MKSDGDGSAGASVDIEIRRGNPITWNDPELVRRIEPTLERVAGPGMLTHPLPPELVSPEDRIIEVEGRAPERSLRRTAPIPAYALYYVCEDVNGLCMYRRQDVELTARIRSR